MKYLNLTKTIKTLNKMAQQSSLEQDEWNCIIELTMALNNELRSLEPAND